MGWKDEARRRVEELKQGSRFTPAEGESTFRPLPDSRDLRDGLYRTKPQYEPYRQYRVHYGVGPVNKKARVICGYKVNGEGACWLCDVVIPKLQQSDSPQKRQLAMAMTAIQELVINVSPVIDGRFRAPKPMRAKLGGGQSLGTRLLGRISSRKRSYDDPLRGYNLTVERTGSGKQTRYPGLQDDEEPSRVPQEILRQVKSLDEEVVAYSKVAQENAFYGRSDEEAGGANTDDYGGGGTSVEDSGESGGGESDEFGGGESGSEFEEPLPNADEGFVDAGGEAVAGDTEFADPDASGGQAEDMGEFTFDEPAPARRAPSPPRAAQPKHGSAAPKKTTRQTKATGRRTTKGRR